jgi:hypothetical protein
MGDAAPGQPWSEAAFFQELVLRPQPGRISSSSAAATVNPAPRRCGCRGCADAPCSDGKLPAQVITYLTVALSLFPDDDDLEVATTARCRSRRWCRPGGQHHAGQQHAGGATAAAAGRTWPQRQRRADGRIGGVGPPERGTSIFERQVHD